MCILYHTYTSDSFVEFLYSLKLSQSALVWMSEHSQIVHVCVMCYLPFNIINLFILDPILGYVVTICNVLN
jgi:hypothetical protein